MKCIKKILACVLLAAMIVTVSAVNETETYEVMAGCTRPGRTVHCVGPMSSSGITVPHLIYNSADGAVYCGIVTIYGRHDLYCDFCYEYVESVELTHARYHDICEPELDLCQPKEDDQSEGN